MMGNISRSGAIAGLVLTAVLVAGCSPSGFGRGNATRQAAPQPQQVNPVVTSNVQSSDLPPIGSSSSTSSSSLPTTSGTGTNSASDTGFGQFGAVDVSAGTTASGRDLSGAVTIEKLLGGWTITTADAQCRLNLTYTAKGSTGRYRASTPACTQETLANVTSWQLLGSQIQLYNEADEIVGTLLKSDNRFVGTLAGGQSVSMEG